MLPCEYLHAQMENKLHTSSISAPLALDCSSVPGPISTITGRQVQCAVDLRWRFACADQLLTLRILRHQPLDFCYAFTRYDVSDFTTPSLLLAVGHCSYCLILYTCAVRTLALRTSGPALVAAFVHGFGLASAHLVFLVLRRRW